MRIIRPTWLAAVSAAALVAFVLTCSPPPARAQGVPGIAKNKCLAGKSKCVSKKLQGLLKCREKCQKTPKKCGAKQTACETKVRNKFDGGVNPAKGCFAKLEGKQKPAKKPASVCTTTGDTAAMEAKADAVVGDMLAVLEGTEPFSLCGNGVAEGDESCDDLDLAGATCASLGFASGTLACTAGCGYDASGCVSNPPADTCGNGSIDGAEQCDGGALGGATCASLGYTGGGTLACDAGCGFDASGCACASGSGAFPATGQTTCWDSSGTVIACAGTGQDGEVQAGAALSYTDNGDGTITDDNTGLMWEKKSDDGSIHDWDTLYTWDNAFSVHVAGLNGATFAGHTDWRVPNYKELVSILNLENAVPAVSGAFDTGCAPGCTVTTCSCTGSSGYWSATSLAGISGIAGVVFFDFGFAGGISESDAEYVRAVRGGL